MEGTSADKIYSCNVFTPAKLDDSGAVLEAEKLAFTVEEKIPKEKNSIKIVPKLHCFVKISLKLQFLSFEN